MAAWKVIDKIAEDHLAKYPTTFEVDMEILERDKKNEKKEEKLSVNERNCVIYRSTEKAVLILIQDCATRIELLTTMNQE